MEPMLRFKADDGSAFSEWEEKTLGEIVQEYREYCEKDGTYEHVSLTKDGVVPKTERYDRDHLVRHADKKYRVTHMNDICYNPANLKFGVICRNTYGDGIFSPIYITYRVNESYDPAFIEALVVRDSFIQQALRFQEGTVYERMSVSPSDFESMLVSVPSFSEQRKIADFLSAVDAVIAAQQAEVNAWKQRKKGVMQKLFSQEVRFKADDGSEFPAWESTTVGELFAFVTEKNKDSRINNVITNSAERGLVPQREYFDKDIAVDGNTKGYTVIRKGDFVYNPRKSASAPFGPFNIYERDEVGIVSPLYTCLTPYDDEMAPYLSWYFKTNRWHPYIVTHGAQSGARHDRVGMTVALMKGIPVLLPSLPEQHKIADCLSSMDEVIQKSKDELTKWQELKKGLLQQMFA